MATLTINGKQVTVSDDFLKLSPQQQEATVNEIAAQMAQQAGPTAKTVTPNAPETPGAFGNNPMAQDMPGGGSGPQASFDDYVRAFGANIDQVPIAGPALYEGMRNARATVQGMTPEQVDAETARARQMAPGADMAGKVFYNVAPYAAAGAMAPKLFGLGEAVPISAGLKPVVTDLAMRGGAAFGSNLAIGTADSMVRGSNPIDAVKANLVPSAVVGAIPWAGGAVRAGGALAKAGLNYATGDIIPIAKALWNPEKAGQKLVGRAAEADRRAGLAMTPAEDAFAQAEGMNIVNIDRGGPAVRNVARTAKASAPEANAALSSAVDRGAPGVDTAQFLTKLVGGNADDLAIKEDLRQQARIANGLAYKKAESNPAAQHIFTPEIENLMQSPIVQQAIKDAEGSGKTWAAISKTPPPGPAPFKVAPDGTLISTPVNPPSLRFWDQVQRNLRKMEEDLPRGGQAASEIGHLRGILNKELDTIVPEFRDARVGAAQWFGADDALEAGKKFALQPRNLPEALKQLSKMTAPDRKLFEIGMASTAIDALKSKNTFAAVKQVFGNPASRELWQATLGKARADQLEMYVKIQGMQEASRQAVFGGSQTFDLLLGSGAVLGGGAANMAGWDPRIGGAAMFIGAARLGRLAANRTVNRQVLEKAAELLAKNDAASMNRLIQNATLSPVWRKTIDAMFEGMAITARGGAVAALGPTSAMAYPQTDTRDYSNGLPPAQSPVFVPQVAK